jgi:hypothetical protein
MAGWLNFGSTSPSQQLKKFPELLLMCLAPALGLPTEFSTAAVRAEAGESAREVATRACREEEGCWCCRRCRSRF